ncbi:MAG: 4-hydroxy-tetrahydrodipicolinate synthase [Candidatus Eisenbacteria bacterium]|uniref:4-hydroxy-tetrahydrodipicolinate synthase n=1 Tax=Eiseniibacteriota bacterium TaxID=2212470 RepID=A0A956LW03_UNCEI|nr:4-hydroxy-tetrahydrodipicolinate synthase [Candidatus Eisenbacteria bacterium]
MFEGLSVAMVTPFREGEVDHEAVDRLVDHLLDGQVDGIIPLGTTGEGPTVTMAEREEIVRRVVGRARGKAFVLVGTGTNNTRTSIELTRMAHELGADGALIATPYYNKPTQAGLIAHYRAIADEGGLPIMLYNVPGRTSVTLSVDSVCTLAEHPRIVAIKEATGSLDVSSEICRETDLTVVSGDDSLTLPILAVGGQGVVSVLGNVIPAAVQKMLRAFQSGDLAEARRLHLASFSFIKALFIETNPGPVKRALAQLGLLQEELRLPLVPVSAASAQRIDAELARLAVEIGPVRMGSAV